MFDLFPNIYMYIIVKGPWGLLLVPDLDYKRWLGKAVRMEALGGRRIKIFKYIKNYIKLTNNN